jgi:ribosomal protein uL13
MTVKDTKKEVKTKVEKTKVVTKKVAPKVVEVENYDASGLVLGRMGTFIAQRLLQGKKINIYNAEKAVITGTPKAIVEDYKLRFTYRNKGDPERSPKYPKIPHLVLKNAIVRMLPANSARGTAAAKNLMVYIGNDENKTCKPIEVAKLKQGLKYIELSDMCKSLGAKW